MTDMTSEQSFGRCINSDHCSLADKHTPIPLQPNDPLLCPECGKPIIVIPPAGKPLVPIDAPSKLPPKRLILLGLFLVVLIGIGITYNLFRPLPEEVDQEEVDEAGLGNLPPPQQEAGISINARPLQVVNLFTLGATPDVRTTLAPELVSAFMRSRGCVGISQQQTKSGQLRLFCNLENSKLVATIAGVDAASAFNQRPGSNINVLLTATPADAGPARDTKVIGHQAVAVIVNPANPLRRLSVPQLAGIFGGKTGDFAAVGGSAGSISAMAGRDNGSEVLTFTGIALAGQPLSPATRRFADAAAVSAAVSSDQSAIGLVPPDRIAGNKALGIGPAVGLAPGPSPEAITSGRYPLSRDIVLQVPVKGRVVNAVPFVRFATGKGGQQVIRRAGLTPLPEAALAGSSAEAGPAAYPPLLEGADRLPFVFRFQPGTSALDAAGEAAIAAAAADILSRKLPQQRLIVAGFADPSSEAQSLSLRLAERVGQALTARGITPGAVRGLGDAMPVAESATPEGRAKNRRVELWYKP